MRIAITLSLAITITLMATVFTKSMPNFCANPNGHGNWIVQPFCK